MKRMINIIRIITGILFIFSGLVKAIDPRGLAYKMQEFFEAFANDGYLPSMMHKLNDYALGFSITMITLEIVIGVALLIGWKRKFSTIMLLLLMILFTFLTSYVLFSGKIRACGCFGDCIPITPVQTFTKDVILLIFAVLLLVYSRHIRPLNKPLILLLIILFASVVTLVLQFYVLKHLPVVDCLPFKKGNNILKLREMPADAVQDKFDYVFIYEKDGKQQDYKADALPDSSWNFVDRKQTLVEKGFNNIPPINDYNLTNEAGEDVTETILNNPNQYYFLYLQQVPKNTGWIEDIRDFMKTPQGKLPFYVVTSQRTPVQSFLARHGISNTGVLTLDATAIKTAARSNPALYLMQGPVVVNKWGWADFDDLD